jgi:hypothetical protein
MRFTTSSGWETIATWSVGTSTVGCAHAAGELPLGIGRDRLVTVGDKEPGRQRLPGRDTITSSRALQCNGCWTANMTLVLTGSTSAAKWLTKSSSGIQAKLCWSMSRCARAGVGGPWPSRAIYSPSSSPNPAM